MRQKDLIIICITLIICVSIISTTLIILNNNNVKQDDINNETLNDTNDTENVTNATLDNSSEKTTSKKNYDPDYDASHQGATVDNPITVQQEDGVYVYYGPGHYDYYAGDNHMSGEYYKERNK